MPSVHLSIPSCCSGQSAYVAHRCGSVDINYTYASRVGASAALLPHVHIASAYSAALGCIEAAVDDGEDFEVDGVEDDVRVLDGAYPDA